MSVKDTLKKKVAPIAVAAATLLTPVATQGGGKAGGRTKSAKNGVDLERC